MDSRPDTSTLIFLRCRARTLEWNVAGCELNAASPRIHFPIWVIIDPKRWMQSDSMEMDRVHVVCSSSCLLMTAQLWAWPTTLVVAWLRCHYRPHRLRPPRAWLSA
jgi:hypothetical protein